jgi:hypothetical protein
MLQTKAHLRVTHIQLAAVKVVHRRGELQEISIHFYVP